MCVLLAYLRPSRTRVELHVHRRSNLSKQVFAIISRQMTFQASLESPVITSVKTEAGGQGGRTDKWGWEDTDLKEKCVSLSFNQLLLERFSLSLLSHIEHSVFQQHLTLYSHTYSSIWQLPSTATVLQDIDGLLSRSRQRACITRAQQVLKPTFYASSFLSYNSVRRDSLFHELAELNNKA